MAVPSMLILRGVSVARNQVRNEGNTYRQPRGTINLVTVTGTPNFNTHRIVTGSVAADEAVPHAVTQAGEHLIQMA